PPAERAPVLSGLRAEAERLREDEGRVERLAEDAARAAETAAEAGRRAHESGERLRGLAGQWAEAVARWRDEALPSGDRPGAGELPPAPDAADVAADPEAFRDAHREVRAALQPRVREVQHAAVTAERRVEEAAAEHTRVRAELDRLRAAVEVGLPAPELTRAERDPADGAPFYRLVDFRPGLAEAERAGLEAALHACGLLNAWLPAGEPAEAAATRQDTWARPGAPVEGPSLADVLRPAADTDTPVAEDAVLRLLRSVPLLAEDAADAEGVAADGRWRSGVLLGRHAKEQAEHIGAGARGEARRRRVAEAEAELSALEDRVAALRADLDAAQTLERAWGLCLDSFPDIGEVLRAHIETQSRRSQARRAAADAEQAEAGHARLRAALGAERNAHRRACGELGVGAGVAELRELCDQARRARESLEGVAGLLRRDHHEALRAVEAARLDHERTAADREKAEADAAETHRSYAEAHAMLATLRSSLGRDAEQVSAEVLALDEERRRLRGSAPKTQSEVEARIKALADAEGRLAAVERDVAEAQGKVADAEDALTDSAGVAGVWEAATGEVEAPFDRADLRSALAASLAENGPAGDPGALERDLIARIQTLQAALAGTHDVQADRDRGILTVTVGEESGAAPVASTARVTTARLAQAEQNLTDREERVFEDYLLGDIAEELHRQIGAAEALTQRMNTVLEGAHSSQGVRVDLAWEPAPHLDPAERSAFALAKKPVARRTAEENDRLRRALMDRIRSTRAEGRSSGYAEVLAGALDYRQWYAYRVRIHDTGPDGRPRDRRVRQLSSGETRLVSYVTLFAASAAFYDALETGAEGPLRMVLLDEAFERLDDPTIARLLELLVDLDMDWAITWPSGYGVSPRIDRMHIYDILKRKGAWGVACARTTWNGSGFERSA
ncbi:SbcC/MukB-like Walker B domain-containing protein, partial [Nocardiopsis sediminis]